jgi:hypothetical protein
MLENGRFAFGRLHHLWAALMWDLPGEERRIYDLIEVVQEQVRPDYATLSQLLSDADRLASFHPTSVEAHYLRGWALYCLWDNDFGGANEGLDEMRVVLQMEPNHQWARWFAIVLSYVIGDYKSVIELFARLDREYFANEDKDWRFVKAWEYALCSQLWIGRYAIFESGLKELVHEFVKVADDCDEWFERPNQLMAIYRKLRSGSGELAWGSNRGALIDLLESQLALLVPGGWIAPAELAESC